MGKLLSGHSVLASLRQHEKEFKLDRKPVLAIVQVGNEENSSKYIRIKREYAERYGVRVDLYPFTPTAPEQIIIGAIRKLGQNALTDGVLVQLPLPKDLDVETVVSAIPPLKDVDNLTHQDKYESPMAQAVWAMLESEEISLAGKSICVVGEGRTAGAPVIRALYAGGFNPTILNDKTPDNDKQIHDAYVVFGATPVPTINRSNTRAGQIIFDCSGRSIEPSDLGFIIEQSAFVSPPTGGTGPLVVYFLCQNVKEAAAKW